MSNLDSIVEVQVDRITKLPSRLGFGTALILDINTDQPDLVNTYEDADDMLSDGFTTSSEAYKAAKALMAQNPHPTSFKVGKRAANVAQVETITPTAVDNTTYSVTINGTVHTFLSDGSATAAEIVAGLSAAINTGAEAAKVTATGSTTLIITSDVAGQGFSVAIGTNLAIVHTTANVGPESELARVRASDDDWYWLLTTDRTVMCVLQLAAATEDLVKEFGYDTNEADSRDLAAQTDTTSLMGQLKALNYDRTFGVWSDDLAHYPVAAWVGKMAPKDPGSFTAKFKNVNGVAPSDTLTPTQVSNIKGKNGNVYQTIGSIAMFFEGVQASGEFIDIIEGTDWIVARIQENVFFLFANEDKVPFDNGGIGAIALRVEQVGKQAEDRQIIRKGTFKVTAPDVADTQQSDRADRFLDGIEFEGTYSGAVHKTRIKGRLSV
jgi:hypothetical protein